jgi:hypothetical protein
MSPQAQNRLVDLSDLIDNDDFETAFSMNVAEVKAK